MTQLPLITKPDADVSVGDARVDWPTVEVVLLDMDGTILDLAFDNYFWSTLIFERYAQRHGLSRTEADARLRPEFERTAHTLPWYCTEHWSRVTGLDIAAMKVEVKHRIQPLPGAVAFLDAVRASGRQVWIATNAHPQSWELKLHHTGLFGHFDRVISSHDFGAPKEHDDFWSRMQAMHPFPKPGALFVDDSKPVLDAAQRNGIGQVVGIRHPDRSRVPRPVPGHATVAALADLLPLGR